MMAGYDALISMILETGQVASQHLIREIHGQYPDLDAGGRYQGHAGQTQQARMTSRRPGETYDAIDPDRSNRL